jgi:hypothetical protein
MEQENQIVPAIPNEKFEHTEQFAMLTRGTSANASVRSGEYVVCINFKVCRPGGPHDGDLVALRKRRGHEIRDWVARLNFVDGAWQASYESTDPRWQKEPPVRLTADLEHDAADGLDVEILGCVQAAVRLDPRPSQIGVSMVAPKKPFLFSFAGAVERLIDLLATPVPVGWIASPASVGLNWAFTVPMAFSMIAGFAGYEMNLVRAEQEVAELVTTIMARGPPLVDLDVPFLHAGRLHRLENHRPSKPA